MYNPGVFRDINIFFWWIRDGGGPTLNNIAGCMEGSRSMHHR